MEKIKLTKEIYEKLENELEELRGVKKPQATESLKKAIAMGDISESSDYEAAKDELGQIDGRIAEISNKLTNSEIVEYESANGGEAELGSTVEVENTATGDKSVFSIVLPDDMNPEQGKISNSSPVGSALLGRKSGETVSVKTPAGESNFKILSVK